MRTTKANHWVSYGRNDVRDVFRIRGKRIYQSPDRTISEADARRFFQAMAEESH